MQLLDLPLAIGFGVPADAGIEGARRVLQQLLLPGIDLVGMDLVALGKVGHRRLFPNRFQRDLRLQGAVNLASRLRHGLLRLPNGAADFQLSSWSRWLIRLVFSSLSRLRFCLRLRRSSQVAAS